LERKDGDTIAEMRMEPPEAEILHSENREKKSKDNRKETEPEPEPENRENRALTKSKQTAQRKKYHPPLN